MNFKLIWVVDHPKKKKFEHSKQKFWAHLKIRFELSKILLRWRLNKKIAKNAIFTTLSQQILSGRLLQTVIDGQKINFSGM